MSVIEVTSDNPSALANSSEVKSDSRRTRSPIRLDQFDNRDFDRGASRFKEAMWIGIRAIFFLSSFPFPSSVRRWWLRRFGATVGRHVIIRSRVNITFPWRLRLDDHVWIGEEVLILSLADVRVRSHVCISQRAFLCTGSHDFAKTSFDLITEPITINEHCWIAAQSFVGPGTIVPEQTMIAAGQVVSKKSFPQVV